MKWENGRISPISIRDTLFCDEARVKQVMVGQALHARLF